jgi:hypothetical protein
LKLVLDQDSVRWQVLVNVAMSLWTPCKIENVWPTELLSAFQGRDWSIRFINTKNKCYSSGFLKNYPKNCRYAILILPAKHFFTFPYNLTVMAKYLFMKTCHCFYNLVPYMCSEGTLCPPMSAWKLILHSDNCWEQTNVNYPLRCHWFFCAPLRATSVVLLVLPLCHLLAWNKQLCWHKIFNIQWCQTFYVTVTWH